MNIVSTMVGLSIAGLAAPSMLEMSVAPFLAQKKAEHLTQAEALAVAYAGTAEANQSLPAVPTGCAVSPPVNTVYTVTCTSGGGTRFATSIARSFRIIPQQEDGGSGGREFAFEAPPVFSGHQCPTYDQWGVYGYNDTWSDAVGGACIPRAIWNENKYRDSNPDNWLYDVNNHNGWGYHPSY